MRTLPFPILHIQTDWGTAFFNDAFQQELHEHYIKFRPIRPRTPHLIDKINIVQWFRPKYREFQKAIGINVKPKPDTELNKGKGVKR